MNKYAQKPDRIIDLHGFTTAEAKFILDELLERGKGSVRLITGKGDLRNGPVLRTYVQGYLKRRGIRFQSAKVFNGGEGALEVFL